MKRLLTLTCLLILIVSCNKPDDDDCTANVESIAGSYKVVASAYKQTPTSPEENRMDDSDPCERDDVLTFKTDNSYEVADLGLACEPSNDETGAWSVNGSTLVFDGDPVTIQSFNCQTLVLISRDVFLDGDQISLTLQKQ
jgi:hypothetical protein